jgi:hypothetical protein
VAFVSVAALGIPRLGVTRVGELFRTMLPVPVEVAVPVPPLATGRIPVTPVPSGRPVAFTRLTALGVPRFGVTSVGLLLRTFEPDPVEDDTPVPPFATASRPPSVIAPEVGDAGVRPVVPPLKVETAAAPDGDRVCQLPEAYPSNTPEVLLNRICPLEPAGRCPRVPTGTVTAPLPGRTGSLAIASVGSPDPFPFATVICPDVPRICRPAIAVPPTTASIPVPPVPAKAAGRPLRAIVGLPATPSPSVTEIPVPDVPMALGTTVLAAVFATRPFPAASSDPEAPFSVIR